jgi:CRP-like cAMP-binding protein
VKDYSSILSNIRRYVNFPQEEEIQLTSIIRTTRVKKRQFIDQPGFVSSYRHYVVKGAFRSYLVDKDGKEHTIKIAIDDWFINDFCSYIAQEPATLFVEALEDSHLFQMKYEDLEGLCSRNHNISEYFRMAAERAFAFSTKRALSTLSMTAEERYLEFTERYPGIFHRVPQKVIASYLGISPEFLSKIRANFLKKDLIYIKQIS